MASYRFINTKPAFKDNKPVYTLHHQGFRSDVFALKKTQNASFGVAAFKSVHDASRVAIRLDTQYEHSKTFPSTVLENNVLSTENIWPLIDTPMHVQVKEWDNVNEAYAYAYANGLMLMTISAVYITKNNKIIFHSDYISKNVDQRILCEVLESRYLN